MIKVRRARERDIPAVLDLMELHWSKIGETRTFHREAMEKTLKFMLDGGIFQVPVDDDKPVGYLVVITGINPLTATSEAIVMAFFVHDDYRRKGVGTRLLSQAENVAKQQGIHRFVMTHILQYEPENAQALYEKRGYTRKEVLFFKEI